MTDPVRCPVCGCLNALGTTCNPLVFDVLAVLDIEGNYVRLAGTYYNDPKRAHEHARNIGGVVVVISPTVLGDYRGKG